MTTEKGLDQGGETLVSRRLSWVGAPGGVAWRQRPLRLAFCRWCTFRPGIVASLDAAGIPWNMSVDTESDRAVEAAVSADLAVHAMIDGNEPPYLEQIDHGGALPELPLQNINLYGSSQKAGEAQQALSALLRAGFSDPRGRKSSRR